MGGKRWLSFALVGLLAAIGVTACGDGGGDDEVVGLVKATDMLRFDPDRLSGRVGQEVDFTFQNDDDSRQHNITFNFILQPPEMNPLSVDVGPNQTRTVRFAIRERPRENFLTFFCRFHITEGMHGRLNLR